MHVNRNICIASRLLAGLTICIAIASPDATAQGRKADDLGARLARLEKRLENERKKLHIPGLAIAVIKDDQVVLAKGFGYCDLETKRPVTAQTLFAIGSTTKAFTATLVGMLTDESVMSWDDPVNKHLPNFLLNVDTGDQEVTVRDLLCHRTGFTRMGVLWAAGGLTRPEVFEHVATAKPLGEFRKQFLYNNIMYMTAGHAAGKAVDSDWASLVVARILKPLQMKDSTTSITDAQKDARLAKGYIWNEHEQKHVHLPMRNLDLVGPAGSINSLVKDMAQWVRFQLGKGEFEGKRLLSAKAHAETWKQQIQMAPGVGYGLGWMLHDWNGSKVIQHGGSIDGFAAQVSLLPEHDLGYVLLANVTATPLQQKSIHIVFDSLVGSGSEATTAKTEDTSGLLGKYVANFGSWRDARFTVVKKGDTLALDVPGQRVYELKAPDAEGKRYFALTDTVAVSFRRDDTGKSTSLTMYQSGFAFECPREGVEVAAEVPLEDLQPLVGTYRDERRRRNMKVIILNNRLAVEEQRGGLFELAPPDGYKPGGKTSGGKWAIRANKKRAQFRFNMAEDGSVRSMTRFQKGKQVEMPRVAAGAGESLPTVDSLITRIHEGYGADKVAQLGHVRMTGKPRMGEEDAAARWRHAQSAQANLRIRRQPKFGV